MKCTGIARIVRGVLALLLLCAIAKADIGGRAPQFTAKTLDGEVITSASLGGKVVLLQFWATWCKYCRRDQPAVEDVTRAFAKQGLVVLAVDIGESEAVVRKYLERNPRSCRIVIDHGLADRFGAHGTPYYVVINREGNIAGTQSGAGGEASLRQLLSRAGLPAHTETREIADQDSVPEPGSSSGAQVIEMPVAKNTLPPKPDPKTVFVFANGERLEADHYTINAGFLHIAIGGERRTVPLSSLDMNATIAANRKRGIELKIPQSHDEVTIGF